MLYGWGIPFAGRQGPEYVRVLLTWFEEREWAGALRFLGTDEGGREVLSYIEGHVPWESEISSDASLSGVAGLTREFHDLTAGTPLADGGDVVCHNDLAPKNTVHRDVGKGLMPVAFIDWDLAGPGERIHDIAHVCLRDGGAVTEVRAARDWTVQHRAALQKRLG